MNPKARGRVWHSDTAVRQAHQMVQPRNVVLRVVGFRLTTDALEESARGGSWKAEVSSASVGWRVEEWPREKQGYMGFRLARESVS